MYKKGSESMIYITGDCHGDFSRFSTKNFPEGRELTKDDYVIICGDFGFWDDTNHGRFWRNWLDEKPFTTLWVDGNHENYDLLKTVPVEEWNGGKVQFIEPSVIHLMRGQIYNIDGCKIFAFGGARSHDIDGGILERDEPDFATKKKRLDRENICYRINHESWWEEEMPCQAEYDEGLKNLETVEWDVDYIVSHCGPSSVQAMISAGEYKTDVLTDYFEKLSAGCNYKKWFMGHYHENINVPPNYVVIYEQIIQIW